MSIDVTANFSYFMLNDLSYIGLTFYVELLVMYTEKLNLHGWVSIHYYVTPIDSVTLLGLNEHYSNLK